MCDLHGCGRHRAMPPIVVPDAQRRAFLKGLASLPLAAVLFDPSLAQAQASTLEDVEIKVEGAEPLRGAIAVPEQRLEEVPTLPRAAPVAQAVAAQPAS